MGIKIKIFSIIHVCIFMLILGCKTQDDKLKCIDSIIDNNKKFAEYPIVEKLLIDTINGWIDKKVELVQAYKHEKWKIDALIFNNQRNRCFVVIIELDTNLTAKLDYITYGVGQLQEDKLWNFYFAGITNLAVPKGNDLEELSIIARKEIIIGGIIKNAGCSLNEDYINGWFNEKLYDKHKKFLNAREQ